MNLELLVNPFNNATPENSNNPEKISSSKYYGIEEMYNIEIPHKNKSLSLFHINACCLNKNSDDLQHLMHLNNWLNANKILLNVKNTEMVIFKSKRKKFEGDLKIKLCGKRLYSTDSVKYLGIKIDTNLS